jgi:hypothetical protein
VWVCEDNNDMVDGEIAAPEKFNELYDFLP